MAGVGLRNNTESIFAGKGDFFPQEAILLDQNVDSWLLMSTPIPVVSLAGAYLIFVNYVGPTMMANKKPMSLKPQMIAYNVFQVLWAAYVLLLPVHRDGLQYALSNYCVRLPKTSNPHNYDVAFLSWCFFTAKIIDLLDTVFFVLRKKEAQITFLHVWHHAVALVSAWFFAKYLIDPSFIFLMLLNTGVHLIMYSYYLLSALGPQFQKYIWWKKYMTRIQLSQFFIVIGYLIKIWFDECQISRSMAAYLIVQNIILIGLFGNFYVQAYSKKTKSE